jgi:hypothetical protein
MIYVTDDPAANGYTEFYLGEKGKRVLKDIK